MKKVLLFISLFIYIHANAQEGTKQFMPNSTDRLWMEMYAFTGKYFGTYRATDKERIYIYLNAGDKMHFGMRMNTINYGGNVNTNEDRVTFRLMDPDSIEVAGLEEQIIAQSGDLGYIDSYAEATNGPNGVKLNGSAITGGYDALSFTAAKSGNYWIEFETWRDDYVISGTNRQRDRRFALEFFDVTVTDTDDNLITNPGDPNTSAGRLWSKGWGFTNTSFTVYPVKAEFFVFTADEFVNKVQYEMKPYSFSFVANSYGVQNSTALTYVEKAQSQDGDYTSSSDISEYKIFLNDPDRGVWSATSLPPPMIKVWAEGTLIYDYDYDRDPQLTELTLDTIDLEKNAPSCIYSDITLFKIETNIDGFTAILLDIDGGGYSVDGGKDRVLYLDLKKGLNFVLWNFRDDSGDTIPSGIITASATFLGRGPANFPLYDVESLSGISTSSIRPFNKLGPTLYWDDTQITDWGDAGGAMSETSQSQLTIDNHIPRVWVFDPTKESVQHNGNMATMNSWFNAIDLGVSEINYRISKSATKCVNGYAPYVGDIYKYGDIDAVITFTEQDFIDKYFDPNDNDLDSIAVLSLPSNGTLYLDGNPVVVDDSIANYDLDLLSFTPDPGFNGIASFVWGATNGLFWSLNQDTVFLIVNTDPTISEMLDTTICTNTSLVELPFTIGDAETDPADLNVVAYSHDPSVVPNGNIALGGTGANRTITITPKSNTSGFSIIYVKVDDGLTEVIEDFTLYIGPAITFQGDTTVCDGEPLVLTADEFGADSYLWEFEGVPVRTARDLTINPFTVDSVGVYTLTVEKDGCFASKDINVAIAPLTTFTGDTEVCVGEDISLSADETVAELYSWKKGALEIGTFKVLSITDADLTDNGSDYTLEVTKEGCNNTSPAFTISVIDAPNTDLTLVGDTVTSGNDATIIVEGAEGGITYNAYKSTTLVGTGLGLGADLDISISAAFLSVGNNVITIKAENGNCELENSTQTNVFVRVPGITVSTISGDTDESGTTATFTIVLDAEPIADVVIGLSSDDLTEGTVSPANVTFTSANWRTVQIVTVTGIDDDIEDGDQIYNIITAAATSTDGNYSGMNANDVSVTNLDDSDNAGITVSALSNNTQENGTTGTFTIVLTSEPIANVTINISSDDLTEGTVSPASVTFTSLNWNSAQTITVTGVNDDLNDGNQAYNIITSNAISADGNYSDMLVADVAVTNIDDDFAGVNVSAISNNTTEAGVTATFTISLACEPTNDVVINLSSDDTGEGTVSPASVTLTSGNWNIDQTITVTGVDDDLDDGDQAFNIITSNAISGDPDYSNMPVADVPVTNTDDDVAGVSVSSISGNTSETGTTATFTIVLDSEPTANVSIGLSSSDTSEGTVSPVSVTFTPANWNVAQTVTVTGVDDNIEDGDQLFSIVTASATSTDGNYSVINPLDVAVTNNDDGDTAGITVSAISGNTSETGTTATFTIVLESEPIANVTIGLSSNDTGEGTVSPAAITFTPGTWNVAQTVTVTGVDDDIEDGSQSYSIITAAATSTDGNYSSVNPNDVSVINDDDGDTAGITVSAISGNTSESGTTATFTIVLDSEPTANVTIGLSSNDTGEGTVSPASLTFTSANWNVAQTITVTGVNDVIADGDQTYLIITSAAISGDGNYDGLDPADVTVINVDGDVASINVSVISGNTAEDGTNATFTIVLTSQPTADVTIGLSSSDTGEGTVLPVSVTFTSANWNVAQTVTVTGVNDDIDDGNQSYNIITAAASSTDLNYSNMNASDVSVINDDDGDTAGITVSAISGNTTEVGGTATFTVVLDSEPTANVTIGLSSDDLTEGAVSPASTIFTSVNWNVPQTVTVTGVNDDLDDGDQTYNIITATATSADGKYSVIDAGDVVVINEDNDNAGITVSAISGNTTEAGVSATFTIVLDSEPTANVTIDLSSDNTGEGTVSPTSITFTSVNWNSAQTITVTGVNDNLDDGDQTYNIVTALPTSGDAVYAAINPADVSVLNIDDDVAGISVSVISTNTTEAGGNATFTIILDSEPTANVSIGLNSDDTGEGTISLASVTFTPANWNIAQTITVTGVDDDIDDDNQSYNIITAVATSTDGNYNVINPADVVVLNIDDDTAGITVSAISGNTAEDGTTATFTIVLTSEPTANVVIDLSSNDVTEGTIPVANVTFTPANWNVAQTIIVTGIDDDIQDGDQTYSIITSAAISTDGNYSGTNPVNVTVINDDDGDTAGVTVSAISGNTNESGTTATFTIVLTSEPIANVTIGISSNDLTEGTVLPASVTFTAANWNVAQTVTVTGVNDDVDDGDKSFSIITADAVSTDGNYSGFIVADVNVTNIDNDNAGVTVSAISNNVNESGTTATFTIVLTSEPTANVTINLTSGDLTEGTVSVPSVTFTPGNWSTTQTITVTGVNDDIDDGNKVFSIITSTASSADLVYNGRNVNDVSVINEDDDVAGITVSAISGDTDESGITATFTIVLNSEPVADVAIGISSDDVTEGTVLPINITFNAGNWETPQTITVTGVNDDIDDDDQTYTIITTNTTSTDIRYSDKVVNDVVVTNIDDDAAGITASAISGDTKEDGTTATFTIVLTSEPTDDVSIIINSNDLTEGTVAPTSVTFTSGNWDTAQTITVTGVNDNVDDGDQTFAIITSDASSTDGKYSGMIVDDVSVTNIDDDAVGFTIAETGGSTTTSENGSTDVFTVVLDSEPLSDVVITISVGNALEGAVDKTTLTFIPAEWNIAQTVTVTGVDDVIVDGTQTYNITVSVDDASSEDSYDVLPDQLVSVDNTDDDTPGFTISSISNNTEEDGTTATFTIVMNTQPTADVSFNLSSSNTNEATVLPVSVIFTNGDWNIAQTFTVTGVDDDIDDGNQPFSIITGVVASADGDYDLLNPADISVINIDNDTAGITVSAISGNTNESGATAEFTVVLESEPTADVSIGISSDNIAEGTVLPISLTFNNTNWNLAQTITITGVDDEIDDGDKTFNIVTALAASGDGNYDGMDADNVSVINEDDDVAGITVSTISNNTSELGVTGTFSIVLDTEPTANVSIDLNSDDITEGTISPVSVTFDNTNWNIAQVITVKGIDDNLDDGDQPYNIITVSAVSSDFVYNGMDPDNVAVINLNDATPVAINDTVTTDEDININIDILLNDSGIDDGINSINIITDAENGNIIVNGDNTLTYVPDAEFYGEDSLEYEICDQDPECSTAKVFITVNAINDHLPVALDDSLATSINTDVTVDVLFNDYNLEDGIKSLTVTSGPTNGSIVINGDNTITYTPDTDYEGYDTFDYEVCDMDDECATATVKVNVKEINYNPVAVNDIVTTTINTAVDFNVLSNDSGLEDELLSLDILTNTVNGLTIVNPDNTLNYTPDNGFIGSDSLEYMITDMDGDNSVAKVYITVNPIVNSIPVANDDERATSINTQVKVFVLINDTGLDDGIKSLQVLTGPSNGSIVVNGDNTISYTPGVDYLGYDSFDYEVCDNDDECASATVTINVKIINYNPNAVNDNATTLMNTAVSLDVLSNDTGLEDGNLSIDIYEVPSNGTAEVNTDNSVTYTPDLWYVGSDNFKYRVTDDDGDNSTAIVTITINAIPDYIPVANDDSRGTSINTAVIVDVLDNDTGLEDGGLVVTKISDPTNGSIVVNGDNTITYTPDADYLGIDNFEYQVCDADGDCDQATVSINVKVKNAVPSAVDDNVTTLMSTAVTFDILNNDSGLDDGGISVTIFSDPAHGNIVINPDHSITYTPYSWYVGTDSFDYKVSDVDGDNSTATVIITINPIPDYLPVANDDSRGTSINTAVIVDVLGNDTGLEDGGLVVTKISDSTNGSIAVNGDNTITYTPDADYLGTDNFQYQVCDADGDCDQATVTINVKESNAEPLAVDDNATTLMNTAVDINVLNNDIGLDDGILGVTIFSSAAHGNVLINADNTVTYTPYSWYTGSDSFNYKVIDFDGDYSIATVTITINPIPDYLPVANDDSRGTSINTAVNVNVLINDTGLEDGGLVVTKISDPTNGSIVVNGDNTITYTPGADYLGTDNFQYQVCDADGDCDQATVAINVKESNKVPNANDDVASGVSLEDINIDVLDNDTGLDDGGITIIIFSDPLNGTVVVNADNTVTYTSFNWYVGFDSFKYMVSDIDGDYDIATVNIILNERPNYVPVANDDSRGTSINTDVSIDVLLNDTGLEDGGLAVTISGNPANGSVIVNGDNSISYSPATDYTGSDSFEYQLCDVDNDCDQATVTITVRETNHVPVAFDDKAYTSVNTEVTVDVLNNDSGLEDGGITLTIFNEPSNGTTIVNADNTITFTPSTEYVGSDIFAYQVTDADGDFDIAEVTIGVYDGDVPGITISPLSIETHENGSIEAFTVVLNTQPTDNVTISIESDNTSEGTVSVDQLVFSSSNWNVAQEITVTGINDDVDDDDQDYTIITGYATSVDDIYNELNVDDVNATNVDDDVAGITVVSNSNETSEDGISTTFKIVLDSEPLENVTIDLASNDISEGTLEIIQVLFTSENWADTLTVIITGVDDEEIDGDVSYQITLSSAVSTDTKYNGIDPEDITLLNIDNDNRELIIPEAFSPGDDGFNDYFEIVNLEHYEKAVIKVYNRWGSLVYSNDNYQNDWDGKSNVGSSLGSELPTGTYFYTLEITDVSKKFNGSIFIKR